MLRTRAADLIGIMNGVDAEVWNPASDRYLTYALHGAGSERQARLQGRHCSMNWAWTRRRTSPLICFVNRLTHQKMAEAVLELLPAMAGRGIQFVLHGEGDRNWRTLSPPGRAFSSASCCASAIRRTWRTA